MQGGFHRRDVEMVDLGQESRTQRVARGAGTVVLPGGERVNTGEPAINRYMAEYNCKPPPLFMIIISLAEVIVFIVYAIELVGTPYEVTATTGVPFYSPFIYNPRRRYEAWRYITYMLIHQGYIHLIFNLIFQLFLGIPLEMVHKWWRVGIVYFLGVLAGSLSHSVFDTSASLVGASGGVYALIGAHFASVIINFREMTHDWTRDKSDNVTKLMRCLCSVPVRLTLLIIFALFDIGLAIYNRYTHSEGGEKIGYAAHLGGALAGLLVGIPVLRNIHVKPWEKTLWWVALIIYILGTIFAVAWNGFWPNYPETDWRPCCPSIVTKG